MDTYKVWSMSTDREETDFRIEYETRIAANDKQEAVRTVQKRFMNDTGAAAATEWDWMAVKLP